MDKFEELLLKFESAVRTYEYVTGEGQGQSGVVTPTDASDAVDTARANLLAFVKCLV